MNNSKKNENTEKAKKVYISGPITGISDWKERFSIAEEYLTARGFKVFSPLKISLGVELYAKEPSYEDYMKADIRHLTHADIIYMLPGWRKSRGAKFELMIAKFLKIDVVYGR